jgi:phage gp29-like protein
VRHDIRDGDARQVAATLTRDLVYPMVALNKGGIDGLARCPRLVFNLSQPEDLTAYADALPKLVGVGFKVPRAWAQEKLHIPAAKDGEELLAVLAPQGATPPAELAARVPVASAVVPVAGPTATVVDELATATAPAWSALIDSVKTMVDQATDLTALQRDMVATFGGGAPETLVDLMAAAFALAALKGMSDVQDGR